MLLHVFSIHYPDSRLSTMINKYFYEEYFVEPDINDPDRSIKINGPHFSAVKFLAEYLMLCYPDAKPEPSAIRSLIAQVFPNLMPYLMEQPCSRGASLKPQRVEVDFNKFSNVMEFYLSIDWLSLFHTAELEERRRGLALR